MLNAPRSHRRILEEHLTLAGLIARRRPDMPLHVIADAITKVIRYGAEVRLIDEDECNRELRREDHRRHARFLKKCSVAAAEVGCKIRHNADPRGYTVRLVAEDVPGNTWGGDSEGWGVI